MRCNSLYFKIIPLIIAAITVGCNKEYSPAAVETNPENGLLSAEIAIQIQVSEDVGRTGLEAILDNAAIEYTELSPMFPSNDRFAARHAEYGLDRWYRIRLKEPSLQTKASNSLEGIEGIEIVEIPPQTKTMSLPFNDPYLERQWYLCNYGDASYRTAGCDINVFDAWNIETGNKDVIVSINDAGVDYLHPDISPSNWINIAEMEGLPGVDDDGNGFIDDIYGFNFTSMTGIIYPEDHGSHVAGTIAAANNNGIGICGIAGGDGNEGSGVRLMYCQIIRNNISNDDAGAFVYAADNGAVISQNSWGYNNPEEFPASLKTAIDYFCDNAGLDENGVQIGPMAGGLVVFAAGNEDSQINCVAAYERVLAVAALSSNFQRAYYSNYGSWVDIAAPGGDSKKSAGYGPLIYSTYCNGKYGGMQGTSMAAPQVSGIAALIVSHFGGKGFTADMLRERLLSTANPIIDQYNMRYAGLLGAGLVDAYAALKTEGDQAPEPVEKIEAAIEGNDMTISWTIPSDPDNGKPYACVLLHSESSLEDLGLDEMKEKSDCDTLRIYTAKAGDIMSTTFRKLKFGSTHHFRIYSYDVNGNDSEISPEFVFTVEGENTPPMISLVSPSSDITIKKHERALLEFEITDREGNEFSCETNFDGHRNFSVSFNNGKLSISVNGLDLDPGKYEGLITACDIYGYSTETAFSITVLENHAPQFVKEPFNILHEKAGQSTTIDLNECFADEDDEKLTFKVSSQHLSPYSTYNLENDILTISSTGYGNEMFTISAQDASGAIAYHSLSYLSRNGDELLDVYPVPFSEVLNLRTSMEVSTEVSIYNVVGACVFKEDVTSQPFLPATLQLKTLASGTYTLVAEINGTTVRKTIVKK